MSSIAPLSPSGDRFLAAYSDWVVHVAQLMREAPKGTVFGLFGPWGSGKTSAAMALQTALITPQGSGDGPILATARVDCTSLLDTEVGAVERAIHSELSLTPENTRKFNRDVFRFFRCALPIVGSIVTDPVSKAGVKTATKLADMGVRQASKRRSTFKVPDDIDRAFVFLDDLDRCEPPVAWSLVASSRRTGLAKETVTVLVCDPTVLGHHVAHALGLPLSAGFEAVLKYVDAPLRIPVEPRDSHRAAVKSLLPRGQMGRWPLELVASEAIGCIPIRDILACLPQATVWLARWGVRLDPVDTVRTEEVRRDIVRVVLFLALVSTCLPNALTVLQAVPEENLSFWSALRSLAFGYTGPMKDSTQSAVTRAFGSIVESVLEARMDIVQYARGVELGKSLTSVKAGPSQQDVWAVLRDMIRG